jgi:glycosyltransferase involved in cell wall biosynthesis
LADARKTRLAIVVSHPIQYYAPLYRRLARRSDLALKVFFTWHAGAAAVHDRGFGQPVAWDIALTDGYEHELVPNASSDPGTHHFLGLRNPSLVSRVMGWRPDAVHLTGWSGLSHVAALRSFARRGVPVLFRGDSHLLDGGGGALRRRLKQAVLERVFRWPAAFLFVGQANRAYYEAFGVTPERLHWCPHSIDVQRFGEPADEHEDAARRWRRDLGIGDDRVVLLFAGKLEPRKQPLQLMRAVRDLGDARYLLLMVGSGELEAEVQALAAAHPDRFITLPFQNQSRMPLVYRLGDVFVLPSAYGETWGLAVNEAMACARPVVVSARAGCAVDLVDPACGRTFDATDFSSLTRALHDLTTNRATLRAMGAAAARKADGFDIAATEEAVMHCLRTLAQR